MPSLCELSRARVQSLSYFSLNETSGGRKLSSSDSSASALIEAAEANGRVILTLDKDFWQLALQRPVALRHSGVILFRLFRPLPENLGPLVESALSQGLPWAGHVSIVTNNGIEMIPTFAND